jgi:hypothetical protein
MPNPRKLELHDIRLRADELRRLADELAADIAYTRRSDPPRAGITYSFF